jgi:internalin A
MNNLLNLICISLHLICFAQENVNQKVVCHINLQEKLKDSSHIQFIEIYGDFCDYESMYKLAAFKGATVLSINSSSISSIPECFEQLINLQEINIINCPNLNLESLWRIINNNQLSSFTISNIGIKEIPVELYSLKKLKHLDLSQNNISMVPVEILQLRTLNHLDLSNNNLKYIPQNFQNVDLDVLDLSGNPKLFRSMNIQDLKLNKSLLELYMDNVGIKQFPLHLQDLPNLKYLSLIGNLIKKLPSEFYGFTNLQVLNLGGNKIKRIPSSWNRIPFVTTKIL